jgi:hypothetical protein
MHRAKESGLEPGAQERRPPSNPDSGAHVVRVPSQIQHCGDHDPTGFDRVKNSVVESGHEQLPNSATYHHHVGVAHQQAFKLPKIAQKLVSPTWALALKLLISRLYINFGRK